MIVKNYLHAVISMEFLLWAVGVAYTFEVANCHSTYAITCSTFNTNFTYYLPSEYLLVPYLFTFDGTLFQQLWLQIRCVNKFFSFVLNDDTMTRLSCGNFWVYIVNNKSFILNYFTVLNHNRRWSGNLIKLSLNLDTSTQMFNFLYTYYFFPDDFQFVRDESSEQHVHEQQFRNVQSTECS